MRDALGKHHPNVAAVLGNLGNLQKEMGDMDAAFLTYQQVLGIESYRLGLSHPDVAITLHNIATIDAARGNHDNALVLYQQVVSLQRKLFGPDDMSVGVTSACMGDVYERVGDLKTSTECFEEALRIKSETLGRHSLEVARLLHKLGKLSRVKGDFHLADSYISRAVLIYRLNKLAEEDEWVVDAYRDSADIDAAIAMGRGVLVFPGCDV
jgi:tetratricopeptide (TPR) repeat protein